MATDILISPGIIVYQTLPNLHLQSSATLISTLVRGEAAVLAIAISLSLLAIQLASTSYSPRVINIIKKDLYFLLVIGIYIISIIVGIIGLRYYILLNCDVYLSSCFLMGILCFLALVPYVWHILGLLQPSKIIQNLSNDINRYVFDVENPGGNEDTIQPITDIIIRSIMKIEESTIIDGLNTLSNRLEDLLNDIKLESYQQENASKLISYHFAFIGTNSVKMRNIYITTLVIQKLEFFALYAITKGYQDLAREMASSIMQIGIEASDNGISNIAFKAVKSIGKIGSDAIQINQSEAAFQAAESLGELGQAIAGKKMGGATLQAINSLRENGLTCFQKENLISVIDRIVSSLGLIGKEAGKNGLYGAVSQTIFSLKSIGTLADERNETKLKEKIANLIDSIE